jgi:ATP-dependent Clp protease, protease subunit
MIVLRSAPKRMLNRKDWVDNKTKEEATIYLYDEISFWGIEAQPFVEELNALDVGTIHLRIDSPGGDVFAARAIHTAIKQHKAKVIAHIDGLAASAASFISMAADEIEIVEGGFLMIHKAVSFFDILGYYNDDSLSELTETIAKERGILNKVDESIATDFVKRTGIDKKEVLAMMKDETWLTADESLKMGFVDRIYEGEKAQNRHDLSIYSNVPESLRESEETLTKRDIERALRDVGLSQAQAKAILAEGWTEEQRDVEPTETNEAPEPELRDVEPPAQNDRAAALLAKADIYLVKSNTIYKGAENENNLTV